LIINLSHLTNQKLQSIISQLDQAIFNHEHWYKNLLRTLISKLPPQKSDLMPNAHQLCAFGKWYVDSQKESIQQYPAFNSLGTAHEKMHLSAQSLLKCILNDLPIPVTDWDHFENHLNTMRLEFQNLRNEFAYIAQTRDPLTEAQTRSNLINEVYQQQQLVNNKQSICALVLLDLDHFKRINDQYGHAAGDAVLISTVHNIKSILGVNDRIYRYGGEEFVISLANTDIEHIKIKTEQVRDIIAKQNFNFDNAEQQIHVTASLGVAVLNQFNTVEESLKQADMSMYKAKQSGRNCIVYAL
jgi:diguanylate cyclase (GGDEF)-like protein